jgi:hypothetical protein
MAGRPLRKLIRVELLRLAEEAGVDRDDTASEAELPAAEDACLLAFVTEHVASGGTLQSLADVLSERMERPIARQTVSNLLHAIPGATVALTAVREDAADALVEQSRHIIDAADVSSREALTRDIQRASARRWEASRMSPRWSESTRMQVRHSFAVEHLDALRKRAIRVQAVSPIGTSALPQLASPAVDAEIISETVEAIEIDQ